MLISSMSTMAQEVKRYALKSGYIKLELTGNIEGTKELWWDDYGNKTCEIEKSTSTTKVFGISNTEETDMLIIVANGSYWSVDHITNKAFKGKIMGYDESHELVNSLSEAEREEAARQLMESMGGEDLGQEKIGNYNCDVYKVMGAKSWTYKGIALKSEAKILGIEYKEMFSEFKPGAKVAASQFTPPSNIDFEEIDDKAAQYWGEMSEDDEDQEADDIDDYEVGVPLSYSYDKFKEVMASFSPADYTSVGTHSLDGRYASTYMKGMMGIGGTLMIAAESLQNMNKNELERFENFTHKGHKCHYGEVDEDGGTALAVEYASHDMLIFIVALPDMTKNEMLELSEQLKF